MRVEFAGTLSEVSQKAADWKAANPKAKIIEETAPAGRARHATPGRSLLDDPEWTITIEYEEAS